MMLSRYSEVMKEKLIIANWKSHKLEVEVSKWMTEFKQQFQSSELLEFVQLVVAPALPYLHQVKLELPDGVALGAQAVSPFPMGSYTGAVNAQQLKDLGVQYVIVGHSERRRYFHENHQDVAKQVQEVLAQQIKPVLCVDKDYIDEQAAALDSSTLKDCVIAYEPLAAIGTGNNEPVGEVKQVVEQIRDVYGQVPVIYGGSVDQSNIGEYMLVSDGALVGGASLDAALFGQLIEKSLVK